MDDDELTPIDPDDDFAADDEDDLFEAPDDEDALFEQSGPGLFGFEDAEPAPPIPSAPPAPPIPSAPPALAVPPAPSALAVPPAPSVEASSVASPVAGEAPDVSLPATGPNRDAPLALYRRYRPDTFDEVIGQEHVTEPLRRALINNKVHHAYLFSGPRGCGKTSSARILARCLNCYEGPTPTPCGQCKSCRDLATGGPGSIDVIEIDAASHGGVDDARDLRERAYFAPVESRYKIYIVDEAHMVTSAGFNAMLKVVEEPPPHVKFIFATTEPEKVIGTIRSRTHHYPFRLVPPKTMQNYLSSVCEQEHVDVEQGVLPLVVRAGAGSVRDSLSVLDQLLGSAGERGVSYQVAAALLGYTPDALLDEIVDSFAAQDAKGVFGAIDKVIDVGQDPRRFAEDLLQRLRDLVIVAQVPDAVRTGLIDAPEDQAERFTQQAARLGPGELTRAAEVIATGLTQMRGTTAPRLHLELMCARVLLPGADVDGRGVHARLDRIERRLDMVGPPQAGVTDVLAGHPPASSEPATPSRAPGVQPTGLPASPAGLPPAEPAGDTEPGALPATQRPATQRPAAQRPADQRPAAPQEPPRQAPASAGGTVEVADVRRLWSQVIEAVKRRRRVSWMLLSQHAQVLDVSQGVLTLGFDNAGACESFSRNGSEDVLRDCMVDILGADLKIRPTVDAGPQGPQPTSGPRGAQGSAGSPGAQGGDTPRPQPAAEPDPRPANVSAADPAPLAQPRPPLYVLTDPPEPPIEEDQVGPDPADEPVAQSAAADARVWADKARASLRALPDEEPEPEPFDGASLDDITLDESGQSASELIVAELGAEVIDEDED